MKAKEAIILLLVTGCLGCTLMGCTQAGASTDQNSSTPSAQDESANQNIPANASAGRDYLVHIDAIDGNTLTAYFNADPNYAEYAGKAVCTNVKIDADRHTVDMTIDFTGTAGGVDAPEKAAMALAQCLSDHAQVIASNGSNVDDGGPCGALYQAYVLSIHVSDEADGTVLDGTLSAGADSMMWQ